MNKKGFFDVTPTKTTLNHIFGRIYISQEGDYPPTNLQDILAIFMDSFFDFPRFLLPSRTIS